MKRTRITCNPKIACNNKIAWEKGLYIGLQMITVVYGILCVYLFYMQSIQPLDESNRYFQSDLPYHISMIIDDGWYYSFTAYIYQLLYFLGMKTTILIAVFLAAVSVAAICVSELAIRKFRKQEKADAISLGGALLVNIIMPFFWEYAGGYRYISYQSGSIWHNSTYQCMKLFALAALLVYFKLEEKYQEGIPVGEWLLFSGLLIITTGIKPSFLTVFAPVMAMKLLIDFCRKVPLKRILLFGSAVLPSVGVIIWQNSVLFGTDTGNGFTFEPWYTFSLHANHPKVAVLCSVAFPVVVLLYTLWELRWDKKYRFIWAMAGVGFLEALCLVETGDRARDGNFLWGYSFCVFILMLFAYIKWIEIYKKNKDNIFYKITFIISGMVLAYQTWCGVYFFVKLLQGTTYWMLK